MRETQCAVYVPATDLNINRANTIELQNVLYKSLFTELFWEKLSDESVKPTRLDRMVVWAIFEVLHISVEEIFIFLIVKY